MELGIIGCGDFGIEVYELARMLNKEKRWKEIFFIDIVKNRNYDIILESDFIKNADKNKVELVCGFGEVSARKKIYEMYVNAGFQFTSLVHPLAYVSAFAQIGRGTIVLPFSYVAHHARVEENCILHVQSMIENDCVIGKNSFVSLGAFVGANTKIGETTFLGPNSTVRDNLMIGSDCIIGMGSVVIRNIFEKEVVAGNPSRVIRENRSGRIWE